MGISKFMHFYFLSNFYAVVWIIIIKISLVRIFSKTIPPTWTEMVFWVADFQNCIQQHCPRSNMATIS
jgi:hypothetical protein